MCQVHTYNKAELILMGKVSPDAWQVITQFHNGKYEFGDLLSLEAALEEHNEAWHNDSCTIAYIVPVWNETWHDELL